jgi:ectoine hydroxylase-related dioxygenase (phytanoyl-CoA dioxygenase family)
MAAPASAPQAAGTLPPLDSDYPLTAEQIQHYRANGHVLLHGVCSADEIASHRPAIVSAADRFNVETRPLEERDTYGKAFLQIINLWDRDEAVRRYTLARRFGKIAADLMGVSGVRIYHDQALFKEPGGGLTPWHQDQYYWPLATDNTVTLWMPLVDIPAEVGSMRFASKSQQGGYLGEIAISDDSDAYFDNYIKERGFTVDSYGAMKAGDATFHSGWTLHSAPGNPTANTREVMTVIYFADGTTVSEPDNPHRVGDQKSWLMGTPAGQKAASRLNPLVYP